jgi:hypothetical protein
LFCHHEIDAKVWPRANFKPLIFVHFQAAVDSNCWSRVQIHSSTNELK